MKAIIFDMDGVLVSSEISTAKAAQRSLNERGIPADYKDFLPHIGTGETVYMEEVLKKYDAMPYRAEYTDRLYELITEHPEQYPIIPFEWSKKVIFELKERGFAVCVASSAKPIKVNGNLERIGISPCDFNAVVTGDDIKKNKPAPDIFLKAAERAGISPESCIVIEDSLAGIRGAKAAGMKAVGITTANSSELLIGAGADFTVDELYSLPELAKRIFT